MRGVTLSTVPDLEHHEGDRTPLHPGPPAGHALSTTGALSKDACGIIEQLQANLDQSDRRLVEMQNILKDELKGGLEGLKNGLENITQLMIKLHNHSARVSILS